MIDARSSLVEQRNGSKRQTKFWRRCRRIGPFSSVSSQRDAPDWRLEEPKLLRKWPGPAQPMGDPVGSEDVQRLQELVENLHSQVSSLKAGKENQWRGAEELWELRRENEQLRRFRDEHADSASAHQPRAAKCDSTEEADGKRRRVLAIAEGVATGSTFA